MAAAAMAVAYVTSTMRLERHSSTKHQRGEAEGASRHHLCAVAMRLTHLPVTFSSDSPAVVCRTIGAGSAISLINSVPQEIAGVLDSCR